MKIKTLQVLECAISITVNFRNLENNQMELESLACSSVVPNQTNQFKVAFKKKELKKKKDSW